MNTLTIKKMAMALVPVLLLTFSSCINKTINNPPPAKTLDKASLTNNKTWYSNGDKLVLEFKSNGVYLEEGTWRWINNSDTMEIKAYANSNPVKYKFFWNTETDMECQYILSDGKGYTRYYMKPFSWQ